jgi:hypothetical protein
VTTSTVADAGSSRRARALQAAQPDGARGAHLAPEQPGDEEARDHEEHGHADLPTTDTRHVSTKQDNGQHRDGAQALDVGAKSRLCGPPSLHHFDGANAVGLAQGHRLRTRMRASNRGHCYTSAASNGLTSAASRLWGTRLSRAQSNPRARRRPLTVAVMFYGTGWCMCVIAWK